MRRPDRGSTYRRQTDMGRAALLARAGNRALSVIVGIFILVMLMYGGYSLWDTAMLYQGAFVSNDLLKYKPSPENADGPTLAELAALNPDVRGWLTIDDTHIDYPVVQGKTDMDYINKNVYGEFALSGSVFMDSRNEADFSDSYCLLYGHHMDNGAMFGDVVEFVNKDYFDDHRTGTLYLTDGSVYAIELFACMEIDAFDSVVYQPTAQEEGNVQPLLDYIREGAVQYRELGVAKTDQIIGLSTCAEAQTNGRVVVFGWMKRAEKVQEGGA